MAVNLKGIDVSTWQGVINWPQVKAAGIQFAIVRAGRGTSRDKYWEKNYAGAKAAGVRTDNATITAIGTVCTVLSAAIYAAAEAYIDGKAVEESEKK